MALPTPHHLGAQVTGQDPGATVLPDCGTGWYFTSLVLDHLHRKLCNTDLNGCWRTLAGVLGFTDQEVEVFEIAQSKEGHNPTRDMLRAYQRRKGGIDYFQFKEALHLIGRRDIVTDCWNDKTHREGLLLERNKQMDRLGPKSDPPTLNGPRNLEPKYSIYPNTNTPASSHHAQEAETQQRDQSFSSLCSHESVNPIKFLQKYYLIVSAKKEKDQKYCRKLQKILQKEGCNAISMHELNTEELFHMFSVVRVVLVIYTLKYQEEIQQPLTINGELFTQMQLEYKRCGERNHRFIPLYDNDEIKKLPVELIGSSKAETDLVLGMLQPDNRRSSANGAPPRPAPGRSQGNNLSPNNLSPNKRLSPKSGQKPVIIRKPHLNCCSSSGLSL